MREWVRSSPWAWLWAGVVVVALGACSGDDDAAPAASAVAPPASPATTTPPTTAPPSPTTSPATTTTVTTTAVTTTTAPAPSDPPSSTTLPEGVPPRVTFPDDPDKQAVVDAAYAFYDAANSASRDPQATEFRERLAQLAGDPIASRLVVFLDTLVENNQRVVGAVETRLEVYAFTVEIFEGTATLDVCSLDADTLIETSGSQDLVLDDEVTSWNQTYQLVEEDGVWRVIDIVRFATFEGQLGCVID